MINCRLALRAVSVLVLTDYVPTPFVLENCVPHDVFETAQPHPICYLGMVVSEMPSTCTRVTPPAVAAPVDFKVQEDHPNINGIIFD